jgi:hypothetical protein
MIVQWLLKIELRVANLLKVGNLEPKGKEYLLEHTGNKI